MADNYNDQYIEQAFFLWYRNGRKISNKFANSLPEDDKGQRPTFKTIEKWRDSKGWIDRAEGLDAELSNSLQKEVINERVEMLKEHIEVASSLIAKGKAFLDSHPIEEMTDALKAITLGIEIERNSVGQVAIGQKILGMTDDQLTRELNKLLSPQTKVDDFIDVDVEELSEDET